MITKLTVGDSSDDGHGKIAVYNVEHNLSSSRDLALAYRAGVKIVGVDLIDQCDDYEDSQLKPDFVEACNKFNLLEDRDEEYIIESEDNFIWTDGFARLYMRFAKLGNPDLVYKIADKYKDNISIGGYGLFN